MIQAIIDGIIAAIRTEYDKAYRIYTESVEQGLREPCFSILCINPASEQGAVGRYNRTHQMMIQYFPESAEPRAECMAVCECLYDVLDTIRMNGDLVHASRMNGSIAEGVLQFEVSYGVFIFFEKEAETDMGDLTVKASGKE